MLLPTYVGHRNAPIPQAGRCDRANHRHVVQKLQDLSNIDASWLASFPTRPPTPSGPEGAGSDPTVTDCRRKFPDIADRAPEVPGKSARGHENAREHEKEVRVLLTLWESIPCPD